jgi:hypothetical protein
MEWSSNCLVITGKSVSEKGSRRDRTAVNRENTRTVMSGNVYEIRQKTSETCRGYSQQRSLFDFGKMHRSVLISASVTSKRAPTVIAVTDSRR